MSDLYELIREERDRQDKRWGEQDHPDLCPVLSGRAGAASASRHAYELEIPTAERAKLICDMAFRAGTGNWGTILVEEIAEAIDAAAKGDVVALRKELVQSAAVIVAWLEAMDRREGTDG